MKTEDLKEKGLTDEQISYVMAENGKSISKLQDEVKSLKDDRDANKKRAEDAEVDHDIGSTHGPLAHALSLKALDEYATHVAAQRGEGNEQQETPVPPAIEHIAGDQQQHVLPPPATEHEPIEQEHYRQKYQECNRVKQHIASVEASSI